MSRYPNAELWIAGEGPSRPELESLILSLGLGDRVRLLGFRDDVRSLLGEADLFVLPSHSEGFGITLVEAMACEVPVLASNVGGAGEVIGELGEAYLLSPTDEAGWTAAMARMAAMDPQARNALGRQARQLVIERFSPETYIAQLGSALRRGARRARGHAMRTLFVSWDGPGPNYHESLFLPIFARSRRPDDEIHLLQYAWDADERTRLRCVRRPSGSGCPTRCGPSGGPRRPRPRRR